MIYHMRPLYVSSLIVIEKIDKKSKKRKFLKICNKIYKHPRDSF